MANEPATPTPSPFPVVDALLAYQKTAALKAALELKVFDTIGGGASSVPAIAAGTGASPRGIRILCDFLTVLGPARSIAKRR
jgi:methyltransferase family protein